MLSFFYGDDNNAWREDIFQNCMYFADRGLAVRLLLLEWCADRSVTDRVTKLDFVWHKHLSCWVVRGKQALV
jgi:hypothetical protein